MTQTSYVFVREDISNTTKVVQVGHACLKAGSLFQHDGDKTFLIVFKVKNEDSLMREMAKIESKGIRCAVFYEPDYDTSYTAFCTESLGDDKKDIFKRYKLLKI